MFPEGVSHSSPKLLPLKSGAARIALGAAAGEKQFPLKIVPVGLYYTSKTTFRSEALLHFGGPFEVPNVELKEGEPPRDAVRELTQKIEKALREVTLNAENEAELDDARIAENILAAADAGEDLAGEFEFQKGFIRNTAVGAGVETTDGFRKRVKDLDRRLTAFGIEPAHLSLARFSRLAVVWAAFNYFWKLLLLTPFAFVGAIIHLPAYELCRLFSRWYARHGADDVASTAKVLAGIIFMPLTWILAAADTFYFWR